MVSDWLLKNDLEKYIFLIKINKIWRQLAMFQQILAKSIKTLPCEINPDLQGFLLCFWIPITALLFCHQHPFQNQCIFVLQTYQIPQTIQGQAISVFVLEQ